MESHTGHTTSIWMATVDDIADDGRLVRDLAADVCVVGAGIAGMTTAYLLAAAGRRVVVLDAGPVGGGMTGRTTAHLAAALDDGFTALEHLHGADGARLAAESHAAAIDRIEAIVGTEGIDCDFMRVDGYLFNPPEGSRQDLEDELAAAHRAGLTDAGWMERAPLDGFDTGACLRFPHQAQFHPLKYLAGLAAAVRRRGGKLFTQSPVEKVEGSVHARVETRDGNAIMADAVVVATNTPINDHYVIHTKQASYTTFVIGAPVPRGSVAQALYWDTADPYHYVRLVPGGDGTTTQDLLIIGGEDHKTGQAHDADQRFARLEQWARERFPALGQVAYRWSGQVFEPIDGLAFIGRNPQDADTVFIATGDSGNGMTHGTIAGMLLSDIILGRENPWVSLYDPARKPLRALSAFARENLNVAAQYADLVTPGEVKTREDVRRDEGAILRRGLKKVAVYRDAAGAFFECSAACTHLGCVVAWNGNEKTWDCPCHGSRFDAFGKVIQGPAHRDLGPADS